MKTTVLDFSDDMQALITELDNGTFSVLLQHKYPFRFIGDNVLTTRMGFKTLEAAKDYAEDVFGEGAL